MKAFVKLSQLHLKLFLREPVALFFTFIFPVVLLIIFGAVFGNTPDPEFSPNYGYLDTETPALLVLVIATVALMGIPINQATWREKGILRRFQSTPIPPLLYLLADVLVYAVLAVAGAALLIVVAEVGYGLRFGGSWWRVALGFGLSVLALFGIGYAIATVTRTSRLAAATGNILFFPLVFLSGAMFPLELFPQWVQAVSGYLPTTFMVSLLRNLWFDAAWGEVATELMVLGGTAVISLLIAAILWNRNLTFNITLPRIHTNHQLNQSATSRQHPATSNKWLKLYLMHCRLFLREPIAFFFTLLFPALMLFVFAGIDGNAPQASLGGFGAVDYHMGGYMGIIIASVALINLPIDVAVWRERQILRRFGATAVSIPTIMSSMGAMYMTMIALGSVVLVGFGQWFYGVRFVGGLGHILGLVAAFFISCAAMMSVGFLIAALSPTARLAQAVGMVTFFPMIFLSGGTIPHEIMSDGVLMVAQVFPLTHVVTLLKGMWLGWAGPTTWFPSIIVLLALMAIAGTGAIRWFKWDTTSSEILHVSQQKIKTKTNQKESKMKKLPVWAHILLAALGSNLLTLLTTTVIISGYAILLGFQARGVPDGNQISAFADQIAPMATLILLCLFTLIAGWHVAKRNLDQAILFGFLVGLAVVVLRFVLALAVGSLSLNSMTLITIGATLVAGLSGSVLHQVTNDG